MRIPGWLRMSALTALVAVACSSGHPSPTGPGAASGPRVTPPQQTPCSAAQAAPQFPISVPSSRNLAIVWLKGTQSQYAQFVVRDITDILHPTTVSTFENQWGMQFVNASELSYAGMRMPLSGSPKTVVAACPGGWLAWSPDGTAAAYLAPKEDYSSELRIVRGGQDRVVNSLPVMGGTGCESRMCAERFSGQFMYSPDGAYISLVSNLGARVFRLWTADGKLVKSIDSTSTDPVGQPTMSAWSGNALYWHDEKGVDVWREGKQSVVLPGVAWIRPRASPGGGHVVFQTRDTSGMAHVNLLETTASASKELKKSRSGPMFLNTHLIWYVEERACVSGDPYPCGPDSTTIETGKTYIYDLQDNTETESVISAVFDVWPHPA